MSYPVFWLLGVSSSGKTTLTNGLLKVINIPFVDNDVFRQEINNWSFTRENKILTTNLLRNKVIEMSKYAPVITNKITPYQEMRDSNRKLIPNYHEIWCKCPIEVAIKRDVKGLYKHYDNMIGISKNKDDVFEIPTGSEVILNTTLEYNICLGNLINYVARVLNQHSV